MESSERYEESPVYKTPPAYYVRRVTDMVPARVVLYMLSFSGFVVSFMMRMDMNMAIVSMVKYTQTENDAMSMNCNPLVNISSNGSLQASSNSSSQPEEGEFDWNSNVRTTIISSFFWCYVLSQVVGGVLTQYLGTKTVFGGSQLVTAICSLLIPSAASYHYGAVIALRSIQGVASGLTWPAMYAIVGLWIPAVERSRFMSSFQETARASPWDVRVRSLSQSQCVNRITPTIHNPQSSSLIECAQARSIPGADVAALTPPSCNWARSSQLSRRRKHMHTQAEHAREREREREREKNET